MCMCEAVGVQRTECARLGVCNAAGVQWVCKGWALILVVKANAVGVQAACKQRAMQWRRDPFSAVRVQGVCKGLARGVQRSCSGPLCVQEVCKASGMLCVCKGMRRSWNGCARGVQCCGCARSTAGQCTAVCVQGVCNAPARGVQCNGCASGVERSRSGMGVQGVCNAVRVQGVCSAMGVQRDAVQ